MRPKSKRRQGVRLKPAGFSLLTLLMVSLLTACGSSSAGNGNVKNTSPASSPTQAATASTGNGNSKQVAIFQMSDLDLLTLITDNFKKGLEEQGYGPDKVTFKTYDAQGQSNLIPTIARQIVESHPDLIFAVGTPAVIAVAKESSTIPIVFGAMGDPVGSGVAESLEHPGKNATGTTDWIPPSKTLDVVLQILPNAKRIGTIYDPSNQNGQVFHDDLQKAVAQKGLQFVDASIANAGEVQNAARSLSGRVDCIIIGPDAQVVDGNPAIAAVALRGKIPYFSTTGDPEVDGQLMTLGVDYSTLGRMSGEDAAAILGGQKPGDRPVRGMDHFTMEINPTTQQRLGITLPTQLQSQVKVFEKK